MESSFPDYYKYYVQVCESHMHLDGQPMNVRFNPMQTWHSFRISQNGSGFFLKLNKIEMFKLKIQISVAWILI